jgi:hypothetical protein
VERHGERAVWTHRYGSPQCGQFTGSRGSRRGEGTRHLPIDVLTKSVNWSPFACTWRRVVEGFVARFGARHGPNEIAAV